MNCLDWAAKNHELTESFLNKYKNLLNWDIVCMYQPLTKDLAIKFIDFIDIDLLCENVKYSDEFKKKLHKMRKKGKPY